MDRAIFYSIMQNRLDLREVAVRFQITEELLNKLEEREKNCNFITNLVGNENKVMMKF